MEKKSSLRRYEECKTEWGSGEELYDNSVGGSRLCDARAHVFFNDGAKSEV